jgi:hypothetical protein
MTAQLPSSKTPKNFFIRPAFRCAASYDTAPQTATVFSKLEARTAFFPRLGKNSAEFFQGLENGLWRIYSRAELKHDRHC